jgi:hypothetical protein
MHDPHCAAGWCAEDEMHGFHTKREEAAGRGDPHPKEIEQRTAELARGLEALIWFQEWSTNIYSERMPPNSGTEGGDHKVTAQRPATKEQWVMEAWALTEELHELLREVGWKPWKVTPPPDPTKVMYENADVLAFVGNILRYIVALPGASIRPHELADAFARVIQRNVARYRGQVQGYDVPGVQSSTAVEDGAKTRVVVHFPEGEAQWETTPEGEHRLVSVTLPLVVVTLPRPGLYRHFKGGTYEVLGTVLHSETQEPMVRYQRVDGVGPAQYEQVRPASMWSKRVDRDGYSVPRFQQVVDDSGRPVR